MPRPKTEDLRTRIRALMTSTEETIARDSAQEMEEGHLTTVQKRAVVLARQLEVFTGPADSAWAAHPSNPGSLDELLQDYGVRRSGLPDLMAWENHIYPYLEEHLGLKPVDIRERLNKTKRRRFPGRLFITIQDGKTATAPRGQKGQGG